MCLSEIQANLPIIEIHVSCKNLANHDLGTECDSICLFETDQKGKYLEEDRTEIVFNNSNPNYINSFKTYNLPNSNKKVCFEIYNYDPKKQKYIEPKNQIGHCIADVQYIASHLNTPITFDLKKGTKIENQGQITLFAHEYKQSKSNLRCIMQVMNLKKMKIFSKNNPFFEISRPIGNGQKIVLYRSETLFKCYDCTFKEFTIPFNSILLDINDKIMISFFDFNQNKPPELIGKYSTTVKNLIDTKYIMFDLKGENNLKSVSQFIFTRLDIIQIPTFQDYLNDKIKLKLVTAIDFTSSNKTLHNISSDPKQLNLYQKCISSVGTVMTKYVSNQKIPVYGFGAKYDTQETYIFPLTFDISNSEVNGLQGIQDSYKTAIQKVELSFPNEISPIIKEATEMATHDFNVNKNYTILLIFTDLLFEDLQKAIDAVVDASYAPISIIIVGVSNTNEMNVRKLESNGLLSSTGKQMKRDVVQFVPYNNLIDYEEQRLEMELMRKIPQQLHQFFVQNRFKSDSFM